MADKIYPQINFRVSEDEREIIAQAADREYLSVSALVRSIVMKELQRRKRQYARTLKTAA